MELNKSIDNNPIVVLMFAAAGICVVQQLLQLRYFGDYFQYIGGMVLLRMLGFRILGLVCPVVVLITAMKKKYAASLMTLIIYYGGMSFLYLLTPIVGGGFRFLSILYLLFYISISVMLILLLAEQMNSFHVLIGCSIVQILWAFSVVFRFGGNWLSELFFAMAPGGVLLCILYLIHSQALGAQEETGIGSSMAGNEMGYYQEKYNSYIQFEEKSIAVCIILSLATCGIYGIIWLVDIIHNVHRLHGDDESAAVEVLLILLLPFYSCYWMYKNGRQMYEDSQKCGGNIADNGVLYLILALLGFNIVNYALIQNDFNKFIAWKAADEVEEEYTEKKKEILDRL